MTRKTQIATLAFGALTTAAAAQSDIDPAHKEAWGENVGWTNWQHDAPDSGDGVIIAEGLYCNWAAPGSTGSLQPYAQRQFVSFNSSTGHFDMPAGGSDVRYAPVNNCQYDGEGAFWYDRNLNLTADETADDLIVMPGSTNPFDLMAALDSDGDGTATILEAIDGRGYNAPVAP